MASPKQKAIKPRIGSWTTPRFAVIVVVSVIAIAGIVGYFALRGEEEAKLPAEFRVSNLTFEPSEVKAGEPFKISVTVRNIGGSENACTVELRINGVLENSTTVTIDAGDHSIVWWDVTKSIPGTYDIDVSVPEVGLGVGRKLSISPTIVLNPVADAYVSAFEPDNNYGESEYLCVSKCYGEMLEYRCRWCRAYLMFDLSTIPANAQITDARLELLHGRVVWTIAPEMLERMDPERFREFAGIDKSPGWENYARDFKISAHHVSSNDWGELTITWNNAPSFDDSPTAESKFSRESISLDITSLAGAVLQRADKKLSIALNTDLRLNVVCVNFRSRETSYKLNKPVLKISFVTGYV